MYCGYVLHILHLLYLWVGMILPFVSCLWSLFSAIGLVFFGFSPDSETFCCFLVFCQELYLPCSGFRFSSGYYFAVRIPASVWLFLWILLRRSHFASVWLSFSFLRCVSASFRVLPCFWIVFRRSRFRVCLAFLSFLCLLWRLSGPSCHLVCFAFFGF